MMPEEPKNCEIQTEDRSRDVAATTMKKCASNFALKVLFSSAKVRFIFKDITNRQVTNCALHKV